MSSESIDELIAAVRREADAAEFPIDAPVYHRAGRDPKDPILFAGSLAAPLCIVGRDLGKDEVAAGQPLIGAAGRLVRLGVLKAWGDPKGAETQPAEGLPLQEALEYVAPHQHGALQAARQQGVCRVRPPPIPAVPRTIAHSALARASSHHPGLQGVRVVRALYRPRCVHSRGKTDAPIRVGVPLPAPTAIDRPGTAFKEITVFPLPHPSPLNRRWYDRFPAMLADRLPKSVRN